MWKRLAIVVAMVLPVAAFAQDADLVFDALDTNDDNRVTQEEAQRNQIVTQNFAAADTNQDGSLSREEFMTAFG